MVQVAYAIDVELADQEFLYNPLRSIQLWWNCLCTSMIHKRNPSCIGGNDWIVQSYSWSLLTAWIAALPKL